MSDHFCHNSGSWRWTFGAFLALLGLTGLYLAAYTDGGEFYLHGLALFAICTAWIFHLIGRAFDEHHHQPH